MSRWKEPEGDEYVSTLPPSVDDEPADLERRVMDYPVKPFGAFIVSGPLPGGKGPGRAQASVRAAIRWALGRYGGWSKLGTPGVVRVLREASPGGRWAVQVITDSSLRLARETLVEIA